ncbi:MAG: aminotransferase class I/II-fold pyridoxal phosphate-dependent enzyme, partial [bacterium]
MAEPLFNRLCLVGIGLIGSSIARVAQKRGDIAKTIVVTTRRPETLARVRELGLADVVEADAARAVEGCDGVIFCIPVGAYAEYVTRPDYDAGAALVDAGGANTVMTRTVSKIFGLGGMRLGWAYAPAAVVGVLSRVRGPFNVNAAAMAAGIAAVQEAGWIEKSIAHNTEWRGKLEAAL